jgi:hypothetical protein
MYEVEPTFPNFDWFEKVFSSPININRFLNTSLIVGIIASAGISVFYLVKALLYFLFRRDETDFQEIWKDYKTFSRDHWKTIGIGLLLVALSFIL